MWTAKAGFALFLCVVAAAAGCAEESEPLDAGDDASVARDAAADATTADARIEDAQIPDAGPADADTPDADSPDADSPDADSPDADSPDAGLPDSGAAVCGDGRVEAPEACDPGLDLCCNSTCTGPAAVGTECRAVAGGCDVAEVCDGTSPACPADVFTSSVACRAAAGGCDIAEVCDGASPACPADNLVPSGTLCRAAQDICDAEERCDGVNPTCPADAVADPSTVCRASTDACDSPETCDGVNITCPPDAVAALGTPCRPMVGDCDVPESCDGLGPACPPDLSAPDATPCLSCPGVTASCGGCYTGQCLDAQELCADILGRGLSVGDGIYTIAPDPVGTSTTGVRTTSAFCDMTTSGGGWTLIYKKSPLLPGNPGAMFTGTPTRAGDLSVLGRFPSPDYVSDFHVAAWAAFSEIRVEILTGTVAAKFITLDALGSTPSDWFAAGRQTASSWTDLPSTAGWDGSAQGRFFSMDPPGSRKFYVNRTWGGCPSDLGWLMISSTDFCSWERRTNQPNEILYSLGNTEGRFNDPNQIAYGDAFIVWAR